MVFITVLSLLLYCLYWTVLMMFYNQGKYYETLKKPVEIGHGHTHTRRAANKHTTDCGNGEVVGLSWS